LLPYFKKSEHYEPGGDDTRGRGGPLNVAALRGRAELCNAFIDADAKGRPPVVGLQNGGIADTGQFQKMRRLHRAGAEDHLAVTTLLSRFSALPVSHADSASAAVSTGFPRNLDYNTDSYDQPRLPNWAQVS
jgi:hypothetical protein